MPITKITRKQLILNSINVFRAKGYYRTTMSDLAKASKLTKGTFYHHFESKEQVMTNCLVVTSEWFEKKIFSIAYDESLSAENRLKKMAKVIFKAFTKDKGGCFFANTILETIHVESTFKNITQHFFLLWEEALTNIFELKYAKKTAKEMSLKVIADVEGSIILLQLYDDDNFLKEALDRCVKLY